MNSCRIYLNSAPHVDLIMLIIASANLVPFLVMYCMCALNRSSLSKITSKYHASSVDVMMIPAASTVAFALRFLCLVKCINTYFDSSNCVSCHFHHSSVFFNLACIFSAFPMFVNSRTSKAISSMNPSASSLVCDMSSRSAL